MVFKKAKFFWKTDNDNETIGSVPYTDDKEYYTFLRECKSKGYRQVIVTAEIMLQVIRMAVIEKDFNVYKIEFAEEDDVLEKEIENLLDLIKKNPVYFGDFVEKIEFLSEQSSIDIRRVYIKGKYNGEYAPDFYLQSNGIFGINKESFNDLSKEISTLIKEYLRR